MNRSNKKRRKNVLPIMLALVGLLLVVFLFRPLSTFVRSVASPLWRTRETAADAADRLLVSKKKLQAENDELTQELTESRLKVISLSALKDENTKLQEMLGRIPANKKQVLAGVLTSPGQSLYNTFQIDAGSAEGIKTDDQVLVGTAFIGTVSSVTAHSATVTSLSNPGNQVSAVVAGSDITINVTGRGGGDFEVELPHDIPFETGMAVMSQGVDAYTIATVEKIISDPRDPFQKLLAHVPVNMRSVRFVTVVTL